MQYFTVFTEDFKLMRVELSDTEVLDMFSALSDLCLWGECEYIPNTAKQKYFWGKLKAKFDKDLGSYNASVNNGRQGGRPKKENPDNNPEKTQTETQNITQNITQPETNLKPKTLKPETLKPENNNIGDTSPEKIYPFEGEIIRLKQKDFDQWQKAYPDLNLYAELMVRDKYLATLDENDKARKNWFLSTSQYFVKRNEMRKQQNAEFSNNRDEESFEEYLERSIT